MGRILFRYIAGQIIVPFFLSLFIITFVVFMMQMLKMADWIVNYGVGIAEIGRILGFLLFPLFVFTVPMSFLLAVMLAVNRMSGDSELTAMKAAGISLYQMLPPVIALSICVSAATFGLTLFAEPWGKQSIKNLIFDLGREKATLGITERVFNTDFESLVIYVNKVEPSTNELSGVFIADERKVEAPNIIIASSGRIYNDEKNQRIVLRLKDGAIHRTMPDATEYQSAGFGQYDIILDLGKLLGEKGIETAYHELGTAELAAYIKELKAKQGDSFDYRRAWVEYHRRFAFPIAAILFGIVALPMGISPPRSGKSRGFSVAIVVLCVYYLLYRVGENVGWKGVAHPAIVMWAPNVLFGIFGAVMLYKKANEQPIRSIEFIVYQLVRAKAFVGEKLFRKSGSDKGGNGE